MCCQPATVFWCLVYSGFFFNSFNASDTWLTSVSVFCVQFCHIPPSALTPFPYLTLPCTTSYWEHPASACFCKYIVSRALKWRAGQEMFCRFFFWSVLILFLKICSEKLVKSYGLYFDNIPGIQPAIKLLKIVKIVLIPSGHDLNKLIFTCNCTVWIFDIDLWIYFSIPTLLLPSCISAVDVRSLV